MKLTELLDEIGLSYSEGDFRAEAKLPYIVWEKDSAQIYANGVVAYSSEWAIIHLVHAKSDFEKEQHIENILTSHGIAFSKSDEWIGGRQRAWIITYEFAEGAVEIG
jgi:hypothetical protein